MQVSEEPLMTLGRFRSLSAADFENAAVLDEVDAVFKALSLRDQRIAALEAERDAAVARAERWKAAAEAAEKAFDQWELSIRCGLDWMEKPLLEIHTTSHVRAMNLTAEARRLTAEAREKDNG